MSDNPTSKQKAEINFRLLEIFEGRCPKCRGFAQTIHELEPRSRGRSSMRMTNRTPICNECHNEFHRNGASQWQIHEWRDMIKIYLTQIGNSELYYGSEEPE